jgi:hypothetical protein
LNQFIFRDTSQRLGPVCNYEPLQVIRKNINEVPTQRVKEAETVRCMERRVNIKQEPQLGNLTLHAEAGRVQQAYFSRRVSDHGGRGAKDPQWILP